MGQQLSFLGGQEIYLDVETLRVSHEVEGGWKSIREFGLAVGVTWDATNGFRNWLEPEAKKLVEELMGCSRIITFNGERFDFEVLSKYADVKKLYVASLDLLVELQRALGFRVKLESVARETLGVSKSGTGLEAVDWWRAGEKDKVIAYCQQDVKLLVDLVKYGRENGHVVVDRRKVAVKWA